MATFQPITDAQHERLKHAIEDLAAQTRALRESNTLVDERTHQLIREFEHAHGFDTLWYAEVHGAGGYELAGT